MKKISLTLLLATAWGFRLQKAAADHQPESASDTPSQQQLPDRIQRIFPKSTAERKPRNFMDLLASLKKETESNSGESALANALQAQQLGDEAPVDYQASIEVRQELSRLFIAYTDRADGRMTYGTWRNWMTNALGKQDFESSVCIDKSYDWQQPYTKMNCNLYDGSSYAPAPGWRQWYEVTGIFVSGGYQSSNTINYDNFLQILRLMNVRRSPGYFHEALAAPGLKTKRLYRVTYETKTIYQGDGICELDEDGKELDCGTTTFSQTYKTGRSSEHTVSQTNTNTISANIGVEYSGFSAGIAATYETQFSTAVTNAEYTEQETTQSFTLNLSRPNFLYQNVILIEFQDGRQQTLYGQLGTEHTPDAGPYKRVVTYQEDGITVADGGDNCIYGCGGNIMN